MTAAAGSPDEASGVLRWFTIQARIGAPDPSALIERW
jgi:hypothetical protein